MDPGPTADLKRVKSASRSESSGTQGLRFGICNDNFDEKVGRMV